MNTHFGWPDDDAAEHGQHGIADELVDHRDPPALADHARGVERRGPGVGSRLLELGNHDRATVANDHPTIRIRGALYVSGPAANHLSFLL